MEDVRSMWDIEEEEIVASLKKLRLETPANNGVKLGIVRAPAKIAVELGGVKSKVVGKSGGGGNGKKMEPRKVVIKGIDDMSMEELKGEMRRRKMKGYSKLNIQELRGKL